MKRSRLLLALMTSFGVVVAETMVAAQTATAPPTTATGDAAVAALVAEVRGLRQEVANALRTSTRMQLLLARLQVQEQRVIYLDRQRTEVQAKVADVARQRTETAAQLTRFEEGARSGTPELRRELQGQMAMFKTMVEQHQAEEDRLHAEESQVLNTLAAEQARWTEFNERLDELERSLPAR